MSGKFSKRKKTMTVHFTEGEMNILNAMAEEKGVSKTALVRQSLRLYQAIDSNTKDGWTLQNGEFITKMFVL